MNKEEKRHHGGKLGPVTKACVFVGINPSGPGWLLLDVEKHREIPSTDVFFQEDTSFYRRRLDRQEEGALDWFVFDEGSGSTQPSQHQSHNEPGTPGLSDPSSPPTPEFAVRSSPTPSQNSLAPIEDFNEGESVQEPPPPMPPRRSSRRLQGIQPEDLPPSNIRWAQAEVASAPDELPEEVHALVQTIVRGESGDKRQEIPVPTTWLEAMSGEHSTEWVESMVQEYNGILRTGTLAAVPKSEAKNIIKCKWVYRIKRRPDGTPHFKSRLVAKGFSQKHGIDFFETFAPTARQTTARALLHLAAAHDMEVHAMDVDQAFLQGELEEEIFMEPAPGMPFPAGEDHVWRLRRPLYGLKQAPRQWHAKLKVVLLQLGFKPSHSDPSLFLGQSKSGCWMLVYVDDLLLACKDQRDLNHFKQELKKHFPMKDLGEVKTYLGMQLERDRARRSLSLSQQKYVEELLEKFGVQDASPAKTPLQVNHGLCLPKDNEESIPGQERYPELIGAMMYIMVCTRPDIAHALSVLSRFIAPGRHGAEHWKAALRVLRYLKGTSDYALHLGGNSSTLEGYSDSSWADDVNDRRSSQGFTFNLGSGAISWKATRSPAVALSSCEAELYARTSAAQEAVWLIGLLQEMGESTATPIIWCDNQSTVALTKDPVFSARSKHIEARYFFIRELVQAKRILAKHIRSQNNIADIFTKPLSQDDHNRLMDLLGVKRVLPPG